MTADYPEMIVKASMNHLKNVKPLWSLDPVKTRSSILEARAVKIRNRYIQRSRRNA